MYGLGKYKTILYICTRLAEGTPRPGKVQKEDTLSKIHCGVEQLVARWAHNPKAVSSSLAPAT